MNYFYKTSRILSALLTVLVAHGSVAPALADADIRAEGDSETLYVSSSFFFVPGCRLTVIRGAGDGVAAPEATVHFVANSYSKTRFASFWPTAPGTVEIPTVIKAISPSGEEVELRETLKVVFQSVEEELQPVGYAYLREGGQADLLNSYSACTGLKK